jgi:hypothetical protein
MIEAQRDTSNGLVPNTQLFVIAEEVYNISQWLDSLVTLNIISKRQQFKNGESMCEKSFSYY